MPTKRLKANFKGKAVQPAPAKSGSTPKPAKKQPPRVLTRIEQLKLLSKLEEAGVLSLLEANGVTLQYIEENKLLSKAEELGVVSLLTDRGTPGTLSALGFLGIAAAIGQVLLIPDDPASLLVLQAVLAATLGGAGVASLAGSSLIASLQD